MYFVRGGIKIEFNFVPGENQLTIDQESAEMQRQISEWLSSFKTKKVKKIDAAELVTIKKACDNLPNCTITEFSACMDDIRMDIYALILAVRKRDSEIEDLKSKVKCKDNELTRIKERLSKIINGDDDDDDDDDYEWEQCLS